ncbi:MAG: amidohydrolase [Bacteroidota bacterium]|nr:amidohydrolase [Bacteroidota bacterium]
MNLIQIICYKSNLKFQILSFFLLYNIVCFAQTDSIITIYHNATIYTVDSQFTKCDAMAVLEYPTTEKKNKILATGKFENLKTKYPSAKLNNVKGKYIYPGFIDAHCHFFGLGVSMQIVDLVGTKTYDEVLERCKKYNITNKGNYLMGRGWDQNDWPKKEYPTNEQLNILFPDIPVVLKRIDGHAALVNNKALILAGIKKGTKISGGEIILKGGKPTGVLIDNAVDLVMKVIPRMNDTQIQLAVEKAETKCLSMGLTSVVDAGLEMDTIYKIAKFLSDINVYAMPMFTPEFIEAHDASKNLNFDKLHLDGVKVYIDGALGSRGALLLKSYSDKAKTYGFQLTSYKELQRVFLWCAENGYPLNAHCIGDSATRIYFRLIEELKPILSKNIYKWRIEHAQVVDTNDLKKFKKYGIIPSVQPTHATSDMYWAEERLGKQRIKTAYAYKDLLKAAGLVALGTDFPVEDVNPLYTFTSAVWRMDSNEFPKGGFQMENALTKEEALRGITIWAAYSVNGERYTGSLEPNKQADFIILDTDLMNATFKECRKAKVVGTYIRGKMVYSIK